MADIDATNDAAAAGDATAEAMAAAAGTEATAALPGDTTAAIDASDATGAAAGTQATASTEESDAQAEALAPIAAKLAAAGLAPEGDYDVAAVAGDAIDQVADLKKQVTALKGQLTKAKNAASANGDSDTDADVTVRTLSDSPPSVDRDDYAELLEHLSLGDRIEVVAFADATEITLFAPLVLEGDARKLDQAGDGLVLPFGTRWVVHGPQPGHAPIGITSFGLYLDGDLVAWRKRDAGQVTLLAGASIDLAYDVIF